MPTAERCHRLLIVDDNPGDIILFSKALRRLSREWQLVKAHDGPAAIALAKAAADNDEAFDLLVVDLNLPQTSGIDVVRALRAIPAMAATPIVVMSSSARRVEIDAVYGVGAHAYVTKPVVVAELRRIVEALCGSWPDLGGLALVAAPRSNGNWAAT